jgi:hypothetical protein
MSAPLVSLSFGRGATWEREEGMVKARFRDRGEELEHELLELTSFESACEQRKLTRIREFELGGWWRRTGATSCEAWVAWRLGLGHGAAKMKLRVAGGTTGSSMKAATR